MLDYEGRKARKSRSLRNVWCSRAHRFAGDRGIRRGVWAGKGGGRVWLDGQRGWGDCWQYFIQGGLWERGSGRGLPAGLTI